MRSAASTSCGSKAAIRSCSDAAARRSTTCAQHGVSFEVIPGITAAIAAGAYAGVPLTDRRHAQAVRLLTGNSDEQLAQFNYSDLAAGRETLAFYMSVGRLAALRDKLLQSGVAG